MHALLQEQAPRLRLLPIVVVVEVVTADGDVIDRQAHHRPADLAGIKDLAHAAEENALAQLESDHKDRVRARPGAQEGITPGNACAIGFSR